eukprot:9489597-Pyramimonas_sp.AAC.2
MDPSDVQVPAVGFNTYFLAAAEEGSDGTAEVSQWEEVGGSATARAACSANRKQVRGTLTSADRKQVRGTLTSADRSMHILICLAWSILKRCSSAEHECLTSDADLLDRDVLECVTYHLLRS